MPQAPGVFTPRAPGVIRRRRAPAGVIRAAGAVKRQWPVACIYNSPNPRSRNRFGRFDSSPEPRPRRPARGGHRPACSAACFHHPVGGDRLIIPCRWTNPEPVILEEQIVIRRILVRPARCSKPSSLTAVRQTLSRSRLTRFFRWMSPALVTAVPETSSRRRST